MFNYIKNYKKLFDGSVNHFLAISILSIYPLFFILECFCELKYFISKCCFFNRNFQKKDLMCLKIIFFIH